MLAPGWRRPRSSCARRTSRSPKRGSRRRERRVEAGADPPYEAILVGGERDRALLELVAARREVELAWGELSQLAALTPRPTPLDLTSLPGGARRLRCRGATRRHRARRNRGAARPRAPARARAIRRGVEPMGGRGRRRARRRGREHRARRASPIASLVKARRRRTRAPRAPPRPRPRAAPRRETACAARAHGGSRGGAGVAGAGARGRRSRRSAAGARESSRRRQGARLRGAAACDASSSTPRWRVPAPALRERRPWPSSSCSKGATRDDDPSVRARIGAFFSLATRSGRVWRAITRERPTTTAATTSTAPSERRWRRGDDDARARSSRRGRARPRRHPPRRRPRRQLRRRSPTGRGGRLVSRAKPWPRSSSAR